MRLLFLMYLLTFTTLVLGDVSYCPQVKFKGKKIKFSDTEIRLFCGDPKSHAYKKIPHYEAELVIRGMLQSRGFLSPIFEVSGDVLIVRKGRKSRVKKVQVIAEDKNLAKKIKKDIKRLYKGRDLTTGMLNSIEADVVAQLRKRGRPCGKASSHVDVTRDFVTLPLKPNKKHDFGPIEREKIEGLHKNALLRFYPMKANQRFDGDLLTLTEKRMLRAQVVQGTYFLENCGENGETFSLEQKFIPGPPRTLRFGAGASTELGPIARARWSNNRWGPMAGLLSAAIEASFRVQSLNFSSDWFPWKSQPRDSILTTAELTRENQVDYEQNFTKISPQMKWTRDVHVHGQTILIGPGYEYGTFRTDEKSDSRTFSTGLLEGTFWRTGHDYELYDIHPQEGDQEMLTISYVNPLMGFAESLTRADTTFVRLSRMTNSGRGAIIGGFRLKAGSSFVKDTVRAADLPPHFKFFGGGSDDVRGYYLRTLPENNGVGALTRVVSKFEARQTYFFHEKVEAFGFMDGGWFSEKSFTIDPRLYYSPGVGLRWLSPIGVLEGFWARAFATAPYQDNGNFFFAGIGGTF